MQRLFCYVDESGQDTAAQRGRKLIFIVSTIVFDHHRDEFERVCLGYEKVSGKTRKWNKERAIRRMKYLGLVLNDIRFRHAIYFASLGPFVDRPDYDIETRLGIIRAFTHMKLPNEYSVDLYIDGINNAQQAVYKRELRAMQIRIRQIRRVRDESSPLMRLADAIAGLARDALDGNTEALTLLSQAKKTETITEV